MTIYKKNHRVINVLKIDRMSLRDEKIGKVWFWTRNNCQKAITLPNSRPLYMANKNIFFVYLLKIFYVSNMAILKCPSMMSRRHFPQMFSYTNDGMLPPHVIKGSCTMIQRGVTP